MKLILLETWSRRHTGELGFALPDGWQLATHQWEVYKALHDPDIDIVFDTAMTGDGKSLAAYLPMLRPHMKPLGNGLFAYPTNELIRDQERQVRSYLDDFSTPLSHQQLNGEEISRMVQENDSTRYAAIKDLVYGQKILLTNPDIFNLIHSFAYTSDINPATLAQQMANQFRYMVFDEFHVFAAPQIATILDALLFIRANSNPKFPTKFLFLSATPSFVLTNALEGADFRYRIIQGEYIHGAKPTGMYRNILQETTLELLSSDSSTGGVLTWVEENIDRIRAFYAANKGSKGLIICNSVFTAKKLFARLRELVGDDISLGENTGMTGKTEREASLGEDLVVATSTVDIGVDFAINLLVFESLNAGSFIQRLGRLGRHQGYEQYHAIALLPEFIVERFAQHYEENQTVERESFFARVKGIEGEPREKQIFAAEQEFQNYIYRWGGVKAVQRLGRLHKFGGKEKNETLLERYQPRALQVFRVSKATQARARNLSAALNEELRSFRGAGLMDVWTYTPDANAISTVNVMRLLAGADFSLMTKQEAERVAERLGVAFYPPSMKLYAKIHGYHDEFQRVELHYNEQFKDSSLDLNIAVERGGFRLEATHPGILKLSQALERTPLCTCVSDEDVQTLKRQLKLPPLFGLSKVIDESNAVYSVAFGHDALLLDSLIHYRKANNYAII